MEMKKDPTEGLEIQEPTDGDFSVLSRRPVGASPSGAALIPGGATIARLHGFDLADRPMISELPKLPGEIVGARTTVPLRREMIGKGVVVLCEQGDPRRPIIVGVLQERALLTEDKEAEPRPLSVEADGDRLVVTAEREVVLRCGDASITLTRAGKVLIKGNYVVSRSTGMNRIKGGAVQIN
jgi:hypothetical protein